MKNDLKALQRAESGVASERGFVPTRPQIFLLSPANASGIRGQRLLTTSATSDLALRLRHSGAPLGEVYAFISSLYFRGKLEYARRFQRPPQGTHGVHIITGSGLMRPETVVTLEDLRTISATSIDETNARYRQPLDLDLHRLREQVGPDINIILLGSIATTKYLTPIQAVFGDRLRFPREFVGCGDMSRGSLLLRSCAQGSELQYMRVEELALAS